jgi:branched-chain amino acid transport system substrate-binding protein
MIRNRKAFLTAVSGVLVLAAAACASSSSTAGNSAANLPGTPLRIGLLVNETGPLPSGEANSVPVMQAWEKSVNASGGLGGHPVDIVVYDTRGDAPTATAEVARMAEDKSIIAAVILDAATESLVAGAIEKAGLPVIGGMGYAPNAWGQPNWLPLTTSITSIFNMGMMLGKTLGAHRTALTICAEIAGCKAAAPVVSNASEKLGMTYTGTYEIASSDPSYTAQCLQIINTHVDYVMLGAATATAALRLAGDCKTQGYTGAWGLFGGVIVPAVMKEEDPGVKLSLALNSFPWFANAAPVAAYRSMMQQQGVAADSWGDPHGTAAYATLELFQKVITENLSRLPATPSRRDIIGAYGRSVKDETLGGLLPQQVTFTPDKPNALVTCYWFGTYDRGTFSDGDLSHPVCDPPSLAGHS